MRLENEIEKIQRVWHLTMGIQFAFQVMELPQVYPNVLEKAMTWYYVFGQFFFPKSGSSTRLEIVTGFR